MTRFMVFAMVGAVGGFGSVFFEAPGVLIALVLLGVLAFTVRRRGDLIRPGSYLLWGGLVGLSIIGPSLAHPDPRYFYSTWPAAYLYAAAALAGCCLCGIVAVSELRRSRQRH
jgi:predicted tellurium resistance membrane protein TerC